MLLGEQCFTTQKRPSSYSVPAPHLVSFINSSSNSFTHSHLFIHTHGSVTIYREMILNGFSPAQTFSLSSRLLCLPGLSSQCLIGTSNSTSPGPSSSSALESIPLSSSHHHYPGANTLPRKTASSSQQGTLPHLYTSKSSSALRPESSFPKAFLITSSHSSLDTNQWFPFALKTKTKTPLCSAP